MRYTNIVSLFALAAVILLFSSCKKEDLAVTPINVTTTAQQGNWRISFYEDDGNNETSHYTGYTFAFASNGTVTATGSNTVNGTFSSGNDDSQVKLYLDFGNTSPFDELNDDWHVIEMTSSLIKLEDVSGGNGGTDYLTFEKL